MGSFGDYLEGINIELRLVQNHELMTSNCINDPEPQNRTPQVGEWARETKQIFRLDIAARLEPRQGVLEGDHPRSSQG
jgi:hypothetical protein